jgi:antitoxin (DNA-binding transcriptional repressor) of toxin-antitoxin stability system
MPRDWEGYNLDMTDKGTYMIAEAGEQRLEDLLEVIRKDGRMIRICVKGQPVADLSPPAPRRRLTPVDPALKVTFNCDPAKLTTEEDWPEHLRVDVDESQAKGG